MFSIKKFIIPAKINGGINPIKKPNVKKAKIKFPKLNEEKIKKILVKEHDFSLDRVNKQLGKLRDVKKKAGQRTLF